MPKKLSPLYAETRILLDLLSIGEDKVSKSKFVPSKPAQYKQAFSSLIEEGCLSEFPHGKQYKKYSLTDQGKARLLKNLADPEMTFSTIIGPKTANGLIKVVLMLQSGSAIASDNGATNGNGKAAQLKSYEAFTNAALSTYEQLNKEYQFEDLVPIYRIRRSLGEQVSRAQFNEWLLEMQANDVLQLIGGHMPDLTPDKAEDSVETAIGGARYYAKRL